MTPEASTGTLSIEGRVMPASNATFLASLDGVRVVYKPVRGERPLWDFPDGTLAGREVSARLVSEALGWNVVPRTWLGEGPYGPGMCQTWQEPDPAQAAVRLVPGGAVPAGMLGVFEGVDADDSPVTLVHEDTAPLRRMALFDVVTNNADRKGGHVLEMPDGHRYGVDHGLTFHLEPKLRTVLWGWAGLPLTDEELTGLGTLREALRADLAEALLEHLVPTELAATLRRTEELLRSELFPQPGDHWPAIPWPPF